MKKAQEDDLRPYRTYGLPLLLFMTILALLGIAATVAIKLFF